MKKAPTCPKHKPNTKRQEAKQKKGVGQLIMKEKKFKDNEAGWAQRLDPLFKIKGKERHRVLKGGKL